MHQSFGSNEEITQRRDSKMQKLRQIDAELMSLHQQREQVSKGGGGRVKDRGQRPGESVSQVTQEIQNTVP